MLKNRELVLKMSLAQRIRLIVSAEYGQSSAVENYGFPVFTLSPNPVNEAAGEYSTVFPSDKALACSWDTDLISGVYKCIGNEAKANVKCAYFNASDILSDENLSEDGYLTGSFLSGKVKGLNAGGAFVNLQRGYETEGDKFNVIDALVTGSAKPDSVIFHSVNEAEEFPARYSYCGLLYGAASSKEEVAQFLFHGCTLIFIDEDNFEELSEYLISLTEKFEEASREYKSKKIPLVEFDRRQRAGEILDVNLINSACDRMVSVLLELRSRNSQSVEENKTEIDATTHLGLFNEVLHDKLAYQAVRQSAVLLKNEGKILPLDQKTRVAVIGECAKEDKYLKSLTEGIPTSVKLPFEVINDYDVNAVGFAHGYAKGQHGRTDLISNAVELCKGADCAVVYLSTERDEGKLPEGQIELITALYLNKIKVIAVVSADCAIDTSFTERCAAVLFTYRGGQGEAPAVLDIITGEVNPSGKLVESFPAVMPEAPEYGKVPAYAQNGFKARFAFGFGLSYTTFNYSNLKITDAGVSLTVGNTGGCDGYATVQMYIMKPAESAFSYKTLRGFKKVFVKKNDAVKVEIPFDSNTFRTYSPESGSYCIEGGEYRVLIGESSEDIRLTGVMTLAQHTYAAPVHKGENLPVTEPVGFTATKDDKKIRSEKKKLSFGLKLFLALLLTIYYDGMCALFAFTNLIAEKDEIIYIVLGALFVIGNCIALFYLIVIGKKRKLQKYMHPNEVLTDMVGKVRTFKEVAKITYDQPVPVPADELVEQTEKAEEDGKPEEEVKKRSYVRSFGASAGDDGVYAEHVSFTELCDNFRAFALGKGVSVEQSSVRALFAAVAAGKLLFLDCRNPEVKTDFLKVLAEYFGNAKITRAQDDWASPENLLWVEDGNSYVTSGFANAVNAACTNTDKNCALIIDNVKLDNLYKYFGDFISYATSPNERRVLTLSDELSLVLPGNVCYVLIPAEEGFAEKLTPELARASLVLNPIVSKVQPAQGAVEIKSLTANAFNELIDDARERCFISEKSWKRIDAMTEAISARERFSVGNKDIIRLEKYSSVLLDCGSDESETIISMFTAKLVPLLKQTKTYKGENGGKVLADIIEKLFGEDDISVIRRALIA